MKNLTKISVATSVVSVANVTRVGVASALIGAGLFLSACGGGDEFKPSSEAEKKAVALVKEKYPDYKILSYDLMATNYETKGEILQKCLNNESQIVIFGTQYTNGNKDSMILTARAFVVKGAEVSKGRPLLTIMQDYMSCLKSTN